VGFERKNALEDKMSKGPSTLVARSVTVSRDDVRRILGDIDDAKFIEILGLHPSLSDLEQAAMWAAGDGDFLAKSGHPLVGVGAEIVDILIVDEDEEEPPKIQ
jgi:hypothetical protein